jgi:hypothetical protein
MNQHTPNKTKTAWYLLCPLLLIISSATIAQQSTLTIDSSLLDRITALENQAADHKSGEDHFMVAGLTTFGFVSNKTTSTFGGVSQVSKANSIVDGNDFEFSPMLLWRHGDKFLMEFEPSFADDGLGVNWADVTYFAAPGLMLRAGYLVLPFGIYEKRLAAGWINKFATDPDGVAGFTDYGVEVQGGFHAGDMKMSYDFAVSNSMQLQPDGTLTSLGLSPSNNHKTLTGRVGWLPLSNSSLEIGVSGMTGKVGDPGTDFESASLNMYALDLSCVQNIKPFQINIKGQYSVQDISSVTYKSPVDSSDYHFNNHTAAAYIMASVRPMFVDDKVLKNFELAARFANYQTPANSLSGTKDNSFAVGLNYWLSWRTVVRFTYEAIKANSTVPLALGGNPGTINQSNSMYLQFSIQL